MRDSKCPTLDSSQETIQGLGLIQSDSPPPVLDVALRVERDYFSPRYRHAVSSSWIAKMAAVILDLIGSQVKSNVLAANRMISATDCTPNHPILPEAIFFPGTSNA